MSDSDRVITFREREFKGSRFRCLLLTSRQPADVAGFLSETVRPHAQVRVDAHWAPRGFLKPDEAKLGETEGFLCETDRRVMTNWWLAKTGRANTPNWDLVSECQISGQRGLILVEAKAHEGELGDDRCGATNQQNYQSICNALGEATTGWNRLQSGFALSAESHYQLSNRFAFAWKLATMKIPVVLVYLGFLDAVEMSGKRLLDDHAQWRSSVIDRAKGVIPEEAWDRQFDIDGTPLIVLIRSARVQIDATIEKAE